MNPITFRPTGQAFIHEVNTFQECIERKEYLAAYLCINMGTQSNKEALYITLIETLVKEDLYDNILEITRHMKDHEKDSFLFNVADAYLRHNYERVYEVYSQLSKNFKFALATKLILIETNAREKYAIIKALIEIHLKNNDIADAIYILKNLTYGDTEAILFSLGKHLINLRKWNECLLIVGALTVRKNEFRNLATTARNSLNRAVQIYV